MKPNNTVVAEIESTFDGENVAMGFDEEAMTHLMGILSEIYTNPVEAVAREYMTNAIDSHIEAGQTRPVEITTPNYFNPNLVIRDYGIGMDIHDIRRTYSKYGASTKRGSDAVNGMLGIGSKSAFAYSNNFTVVGVKNGRMVSVSVSRNADGVGTMTILADTDTDQPNGVTITVPVSDANRMTEAVKRVTRILPEGTVLLNGEEPSERGNWNLVASDVVANGVTIKNLWRVPVAQYGKPADRIIMGNVAYEPTQSLRIPGTDNLNSSIYAEVEMGAVVFAPSREKLMDVRRTQDAQEAVREVFKKNLRESLLKDIESSESRFDALLNYSKEKDLLSNLGTSSVTYKGKPVPSLLTNVYESKGDQLAVRIYRVYNSRDKVQHASAFSYHALMSCMMVVTGAPDKSLTATMRKKIDQYMSKNNIHASPYASAYSNFRTSVLVIPERVDISDNEWLDGLKTVDWDTINAEVLPRAERSSSGDGIKTAGKHFVLNSHGRFDLTEVDFDDDILYITATDVRANWRLLDFATNLDGGSWGNKYTELDLRKVMERLYPAIPDDTLLVNVYANRVEKFLREYKNAKPLTQQAARDMLVKHIISSTTDDEIKQWAARHHFTPDSSTYRFVPDADPDSKIVRPAVNYDAAYRKINGFEAVLRQDKAVAEKMDKAKVEMAEVAKRVRMRYPLLDAHFYGNMSTERAEAMERYYELDYQRHLVSQKEKKNV